MKSKIGPGLIQNCIECIFGRDHNEIKQNQECMSNWIQYQSNIIPNDIKGWLHIERYESGTIPQMHADPDSTPGPLGNDIRSRNQIQHVLGSWSDIIAELHLQCKITLNPKANLESYPR